MSTSDNESAVLAAQLDLAGWAAALDWSDVPEAVRRRFELVLFDALGVTAVGGRLPERAALIRLIIAEATRFPMLVQPWRDRGTVTDIISAQLSRLADRGLLTFDDPVQATQHLSALTLSQLNTRSLFGTLPLTDAEIEQVIRSGVHVYLLAYGPRP